MDIVELGQIITAIGSAIGAIGGAAAAVVSIRNGQKITEVHVSTNSRMDALLAATRLSSTAEGVLAGRAQVHEEAAAVAAVTAAGRSPP